MLAEPIVVQLATVPEGATAWTSYVTPAATWRAEDLPVRIGFGTAPPAPLLDEDAVIALDLASRAWMVPACTSARLEVVASRAGIGDPGGNGTNDVVVHVDDWPPPLAGGAAAHTVIYATGDRVVEADVHLNARDFTFTIGAAPPAIDLRAILTHELGHVLGIGHTDVARATMNAGLPSGIAARSLEDDDVAAVCALYPGASSGPRGCADGPACPADHACVGVTCERVGEASNLGAPCADASQPRRCDGAGDQGFCVQTSLGERCAVPCTLAVTDCGEGLACVASTREGGDDEAWCLPVGASFPDAGPDAGAPTDGGTDAGEVPPHPTPRDGGCTFGARARHARAHPTALALALLAAAALARRQRRRGPLAFGRAVCERSLDGRRSVE